MSALVAVYAIGRRGTLRALASGMANTTLRSILAYAGLGLIACSATGERTYGGAQNQNASSIRATADGGAIIGGTTARATAGATDAYVLKLDDEGDVAWSRTLGGAGIDRGAGVVPAGDGGYFVAITTESEGPGNPDDHGSYINTKLVKLDASGAVAWERIYGETRPDGVESLASTADGGVVLAGYTHNTAEGPAALILRYNAAGSLSWVVKLETELPKTIARSVIVARDGSIVIAGSSARDGQKSNGFVAKLSDAGAVQWTRSYGGELSEQFEDVRETADGGFIAAGYRSDWWPELRNTDAIVVKFHIDGPIEWEGSYGGANNDEAAAIEVVADGYVLTGATHSYGDSTALSSDIWVTKLDSNGIQSWNRTYGGSGQNYGTDIRALPSGKLLVAGDTFPDFALVNAYDIYVARLGDDGQLD